MRNFIKITAIVFILSALHAIQATQPPNKATKAPPLNEATVASTTDLGLWDDVCVVKDQDIMILRREDELFTLAAKSQSAPKKTAKVPIANYTRIIAAAENDGKYWLFMQSSKATPCAIEARTGRLVSFEIAGLVVPGSQAPEIQSYVIVPHAKSAILMIAGGDRATRPNPGNRPVFFWFNLATGKVIRLPNGWQLNFFSADELFAQFADVSKVERVTRHVIDMKTGEEIDSIPGDNRKYLIPFDWGNKHKIKQLSAIYQSGESSDAFTGVSVDGLVLPVEFDRKEFRYLAMAKAGDGFAGIRLRRNGGNAADPSPLWMVPFSDPLVPEVIALGVTDFAILGRGNTLFVTNEDKKHKSKEHRRHYEAFLHDNAGKSYWNVLDGVERLPRLEKEFADADYIEDSLNIRLIESFGASRSEPLVLCLFEHRRWDLRANFALGAKRFKSITWRRAVALTHDGRRFMTPLFQNGNVPDHVWLHQHGKVITGTYEWQGVAPDRKCQVQLMEWRLKLP